MDIQVRYFVTLATLLIALVKISIAIQPMAGSGVKRRISFGNVNSKMDGICPFSYIQSPKLSGKNSRGVDLN
jgi:hypothetical protein